MTLFQTIIEKGTLGSLIVAFMRSTSPLAVQSELTAALAVLSADGKFISWTSGSELKFWTYFIDTKEYCLTIFC